nr:MAG TPA: hypothetical protein [Caudoviricetes sp.]
MVFAYAAASLRVSHMSPSVMAGRGVADVMIYLH